MVACQSNDSYKITPISINDSLEINSNDVFRIYHHVLKTKDGKQDSLLVLVDKNTGRITYVDKNNEIVKIDTVNSRTFNNMDDFLIKNDTGFLFLANGVKLVSSDFKMEYSFKSIWEKKDSFFYYMGTSYPIINDDNSFIEKKGAYLDINIDSNRISYFKNSVLTRISLEDSIRKNDLNVFFPISHHNDFYNDLYPLYYYNNDIVVYTFGHWDTVVFINKNKIDSIELPKTFSSLAPPFDIFKIGQIIESKKYYAENTNNTSIILNPNKDKIFLFQTEKVENYIDEATGMTMDYLFRPKRLLIYDLKKKAFEKLVFQLPQNSFITREVFFNGKLYFLRFNDEKIKVILLETNL